MKDPSEKPPARRAPLVPVAILLGLLVIGALVYGSIAGRQTNSAEPNGGPVASPIATTTP